MKRILFIILIVFIIYGCAVFNRNLNRGEVYEGTGQGYRGSITVQVFMNGADIMEIVVADSVENRFVGAEAIEELIDTVIMYNSTDIDAVSGATETSRGFLEAVENAIMKK